MTLRISRGHAARGRLLPIACVSAFQDSPVSMACATLGPLPSKKEQGEFHGVSMNMCMRLAHYMIMQGLGVTKDWDRNAHDNLNFVSCVHLRNMSHISLGLLSMFLHTCCDKSLIPANKGNLRLLAPSPVFKSKEEAQIEYDVRLHTDTHQHRMRGKSDNVLSVASRMVNNINWEILEFANGQCALWYMPVLRDYVQMCQAQTRANFFPFPPESVAHTAFMNNVRGHVSGKPSIHGIS
jgi:hypothetical protein